MSGFRYNGGARLPFGHPDLRDGLFSPMPVVLAPDRHVPPELRTEAACVNYFLKKSVIGRGWQVVKKRHIEA